MWRGRRGGPWTLYRTTDANLDCAFVENTHLFEALKKGRPHPDRRRTNLGLVLVIVSAFLVSHRQGPDRDSDVDIVPDPSMI